MYLSSDKKVIIWFIVSGLVFYFFKNFLSLKYVILGSSGLIAFLCMIYWKRALIFLLYWILLEGAFRKWIFPFMHKELFGVKFLILFSIYIGYLLNQKIKGKGIFPYSSITILIIVYLLMGFAQIFNPKLPNIKIGIIGFVVEFSFVPLIFVVKEVFNKEEKLYKFLKIYAFSSLPFMLLGIIQYNLPPTHILNYYVGGLYPTALMGEVVRVISTFPFVKTYSTYLRFISIILLYIITTQHLRLYEKIYTYTLITLSILSLFLTGSRGHIIATLFEYFSFFVIIIIKESYKYKFFLYKWVLRIGLLTGISILFLFFTPWGNKIYDSFMLRMGRRGIEDIKGRIIATYTDPISFFEYAGFFGYGAGSAYQGSVQFVENEEAWGNMPRAFEPEPEKLLLEYGFLGFLLILILRLSILFSFFNKFLITQNFRLKYFYLLIFLYIIPVVIMLFQINFDTFRNLLFWFLSGFLFCKFEK